MRSLAVCLSMLLIAASSLLAGCSSSRGWCCHPGDPVASTQAACRGGATCIWPPERGTLDPGETQLTPSLNKVLCCPSFRDQYRYTRAPFECSDRDRRFQAAGR